MAEALVDYPVDLQVDYPETSSRGWAAATIFLIRFVALIPHFIVLLILGFVTRVTFLVAQVIVLSTGSFPAGLHDFMSGVVRWQARVYCFALGLTDKYPPFGLDEDDFPGYPVHVRIERPTESSRLYAGLTLAFSVIVIWWIRRVTTTSAQGIYSSFSKFITYTLRYVMTFPHLLVVGALSIAALALFAVMQWAVLFTGKYPRGAFDFVVGTLRWSTRVGAYTLGLADKYPPFSMDPSAGPGEQATLSMGAGPWGPLPTTTAGDAAEAGSETAPVDNDGEAGDETALAEYGEARDETTPSDGDDEMSGEAAFAEDDGEAIDEAADDDSPGAGPYLF